MIYKGKAIKLVELDAGVLQLEFDLQGETVNKFNTEASRELTEVVGQLESREGTRGLLIVSGKDSFIVGADVMEFGAIFQSGRAAIAQHVAAIAKLFNRIEELPFPTVVAVNGFALGGGFEICLACDFRIAATTAKVGLPEVKLGILPGWGGTVRLPRIIGVDTALEWMATGQEQDAQAALKAGAVDGIADPVNLRSVAEVTLRQAMSGKLDYQARREQKRSPLRHNKTESLLAFESAKMLVAAKAGKNYPAPVTIVETVQRAARSARDAAQKIELEAFVNLTQLSATRALVGLFVNDQLLMKKAKRMQTTVTRPVSRAAVIGAGVMGGGIAYQSASKGIPVVMKDITQTGLDAGMSEATNLVGKQVERGKVAPAEAVALLARISPTLNYEQVVTADLVVEAVVEHPKVKIKVLGEVEQQMPQDAVLCSNTSTISISLLARGLQRPQSFCGMHFFNPVHKMPLVEVIRGEQTSDETIARTVAYAAALGKKVVVVNDCPGFLVNRVLFPYFSAFSLLLHEGADYQRIDRVMEGFGWPMGPAQLLDVVGMDVAVHADKVMAEGFPERMQRNYKSAMEVLYENGRLGQKTGRGFYDYELDKKGRLAKIESPESHELVRSPATASKSFTDDDIVARMMVPMAIEVARCLEERIVETPSEADMALIYGLGFPPFRGGVCQWIDDMGAAAFVAMARNYESTGPLYALTDGLRRMALEGKRFYPV